LKLGPVTSPFHCPPEKGAGAVLATETAPIDMTRKAVVGPM
jgi:hypothetical protein